MNAKPIIYIVYKGEVDPDDTADATILETLAGEITPEQLEYIDSFWEKLPHTIIQYEVSGPQLINARVYEKPKENNKI